MSALACFLSCLSALLACLIACLPLSSPVFLTAVHNCAIICVVSSIYRSSIYNSSLAKEYVEALMSRAARPFCTLFQITGHNRARQRDKWAHLLEDLSNLQEEVFTISTHSMSRGFSSCTCIYIQIILRGIISYFNVIGLIIYGFYEFFFLSTFIKLLVTDILMQGCKLLFFLSLVSIYNLQSLFNSRLTKWMLSCTAFL